MLGSRYESVFLKASVFPTKIHIVGTEKNKLGRYVLGMKEKILYAR